MKSQNGILIKRILFFDFHIYQNEILNMNLISIINDILYLKTNDTWHENQAKILRQYVSDLKTWIHNQESNETHNVSEFTHDKNNH
jgi:hypothetical protein